MRERARERALISALLLVALAASAQEPVKPRPALTAPLAARTTLLDLEPAGARILAVGQRGHILISDDGKSWRQVTSPVDATLNRARLRDEKVGWAVGYDAAILGTADGGQTWKVEHFDAQSRALHDVLPLANGSALAVGAYGTFLARGPDGAWAPKAFPLGDLGQHFNAILRLGDGSLLIAGERGLLARSQDEGETWALLDSPYVGSFFGALPVGPSGFVVYGLRGNVYACTDVAAVKVLDPATYDPFTRETVQDESALAAGGWKRLATGTTESLFGGSAGAGEFLLVGVNGVTVRIQPETGVVTPAGQLGETLADVLWTGGRWLAVGRRGVQELGALTSPR